MCAIYGYLDLEKNKPIADGVLGLMLEVLRHRGPDETGVYEKPGIGLGHARLSIVGLGNGRQPLTNEDQNVWCVYAGEIFNHKALRRALESRGHRFRTDSDGEIVVHLYEDRGMDFLKDLNGQFAFALWDAKERELVLCRDRLGILPLFYTQKDGTFLFASEIKGLLNVPGMEARVEPKTLAQIFTFWTPLPGATMFRDIFQLEPGHFLRVSESGIRRQCYWKLEYPAHDAYEKRDPEEWREGLHELLEDAVKIRLQADVPVGVYLSGGLDSSIIAALAVEKSQVRPRSFSLRFEDSEYDEGTYQSEVTEYLGLSNVFLKISQEEIARAFSKSIYHAETPVLRTAIAPMYLLSRHVRQNHFKAVLTGEGADEMFLGYDIFKEVFVRKYTQSIKEADLYSYMNQGKPGVTGHLSAFFGVEHVDVDRWDSSHAIRWKMTARLKRFFSKDLIHELAGYDPVEELRAELPPEFMDWEPVARAQYLECRLFLSHYLLSSQGDRMSMANSVEARYPYLDHRVVEFANRIPSINKMKRVFEEKWLLKETVKGRLPDSILKRRKYPYRAPTLPLASLMDETLSDRALSRSAYWDPGLVGLLRKKASHAKPGSLSESDQMAVAGIASFQKFHSLFIDKPKEAPDAL